MSVTPNQIFLFGSANMPEADSATVGGAVDMTKKVMFLDLASTQAVDLVSSSSSDTATKCQISGRDSTGAVQTPAAITLTGTTVLTSTFGGQTFERLLSGVITGGAIGALSNPGGTAAVGDIAVMSHTRIVSGHTAQTGAANTSGTTPPLFKLQSGDGATLAALPYAGLGAIIRIVTNTGAAQLRQVVVPYASGTYGADIVAVNRDWGTLPDATSTYDLASGFLFDVLPASIASQTPITAITRLFATAAADVPGGSQRIYYEKLFGVNLNTTTALVGAQIEILDESGALPSGALLDLALCTALNDTNTQANRQTTPTTGAGSFVTQPSLISLPSTGNLPSGAAPNSAGAIGMYARLTLPAGTGTYKGAARIRTTGTTT
jgi:hypothetical protein